MRHHVIFLAAYLDAAEVKAAEKNLQAARNILNRNTQRAGAIAVNVEPQLRFVDLEGGADVDEDGLPVVFQLLEFGHEFAGVTIQRVEVLRLNRQLKRRTESARESLRNLRNGDRALDFVDKTALQSARAAHDFLHGAFAVLFEVDESDALIRFARSVHRQRDDGAVQLNLRRLFQNVLDLVDHAAGVFAGRAARRNDKREQQAAIFFRQKLLLQPGINQAHQDQTGQARAQHRRAMHERPFQRAAIGAVKPIEQLLERNQNEVVMFVLGGLENSRGHRRRKRQSHERRDDDRTRYRHGELDKQPARLALLKSERRENRHQRNGNRDDGKGDFFHRLERGGQRFLALLDMAENILQHHDRVVHNHADGEHEREHGENVHRIAERVENRERADDGNGNRDGRNERRAHVAQEQINHQHHQHERNAERGPDFMD